LHGKVAVALIHFLLCYYSLSLLLLYCNFRCCYCCHYCYFILLIYSTVIFIVIYGIL